MIILRLVGAFVVVSTLTVAACSSNTTTGGPGSTPAACLATGAACADTSGSESCCDGSTCKAGVCKTVQATGSSCTTNDDCLGYEYTGVGNGGDTGEDCAVVASSSLPTSDAGASSNDGGAGAGKACLVRCNAPEKGRWICDNGLSGGGTTAFMCDGAHYQSQGKCDNCRPVQSNVPGTGAGTLLDAVACGTGRPIQIDYAIAGQPCEPDVAQACSFDKTSQLRCNKGVWVVLAACTGITSCGYYSPGIGQCPADSSGCIGCR